MIGLFKAPLRSSGIALLDDEDQPVGIAELKLDDVDQTLWNIFKVASALDHPSVEAAYILAAAPRQTWDGHKDAVELFRSRQPEEWYSRFMFEEYSKSWTSLLRNGRGRPQHVPRILQISPLATLPVANFPPYEARLVRVSSLNGELPLVEGWPPEQIDAGELPDNDLTVSHLPRDDSRNKISTSSR